MAKQVLTDLAEKVTRATTVMDSAEQLITGIQARIDEAVAKAQENGATEEELAPLTELSAALEAESDQLTAAITANTPAGEPEDPPSGARRGRTS